MTAVPDLVTVVDRLLAEDGGCVWNRAQTHASLARYAVEESYELVDAIDDGDPDDVREELGDLLYQVVLHAGIAARAGDFTLEDVAVGVRDKMTRRHPHVFGDETADTVEDVVRVWRAAKAAEKASRRSAFDGVPRALPPLERAVKLLERLEERGDADAVVASVVGAGSGVGLEARGAFAASAASDAPADDGVGAVDAEWGRAVLGEVAAAARRGVDPVASLRAAVSALEEAGRAVE
ncbi:MazG family protein [Curtobacterium flaccumfaciens]|uniref:MazG family protein n=1 Tax=Curtobacterium flaccumfaciens TaxID=2035 RepID=UPI001BDF16F1|nr:MazG family protein [Curtobacterium flaccumfaciens]MBT1606583.1 MazG family protein [Curtobacterium flaccumfaciens pv. betae]MBT1658049.1 MazG family protein [Curtobacterium flaccumfaciens pv. betae]MCS0471371.1 MazG family protein [Curtobacterium flaccumfaciens pv. betae]MCS0476034.1 MazG family protein [Curtobacterium flaccumfaciens pv. betae]MCS0477498.1 MazG family protein [Curtobacterium flaccumfaciens pv. betae]